MTESTVTEAIEGTDLATTLVQLAHVVQHVFAEVSRDHDLTPQQAQLLCVLIGGPVGMTELSHSLHLEKSSVTGLADRVERRGLIARAPDPGDRRACRIALTTEGRRLAVQSHEEISVRLEALAGELEPADKQRLVSLIAQIVSGRGVALITE